MKVVRLPERVAIDIKAFAGGKGLFCLTVLGWVKYLVSKSSYLTVGFSFS